MSVPARIALLGFGEVGQILADDLRGSGAALSVFDSKFDDAGSQPSRAAGARALRLCRDAAEAVGGSELVISAVTPAQTLRAAEDAAPALGHGAFYLDLNSASPGAKTRAAGLIGKRGAHYVEAAVMAPVAPKRIAAPMLLGGPATSAFLPMARALGFAGAVPFSDEYGQAAAAKLCRSVVVKGLEALLAESLVVARHYGVDQAVLRSLQGFAADGDWQETARYMLSRAIQHGVRRAEELREAASMVADAGLFPSMSAACAERQQWASRFAPLHETRDLGALLDALREGVAPGGEEPSAP
jgi:3-hydroxyisobutyrate dehydrogenase-like beta-hydroxyacid dehydrogenase